MARSGKVRKRSLVDAALAAEGKLCSGHGTAVFREPDKAFLDHLHRQGYAVLQGVFSAKDRARFLQAFWGAMAHLSPSTVPEDRSSWRMPIGFRGIVSSYGLAQSDFAWMVRSAPRVRGAFERIFGSSDLCVSLDAVVVQDQLPKTRVKPMLHKDQRPELADLSVQAIYNFDESGPSDCGTCVVPGTHKRIFAWERGSNRDFIRVPEEELSGFRPVKPDVPSDSILFFNSRLVHAAMGGRVLRADDPVTGLPRPSRLGACVAWAPRVRRSEKTRLRKEAMYFAGKCSTHWPCDRLAEKPPPKKWEILPGATPLPHPVADPSRLAML